MKLAAKGLFICLIVFSVSHVYAQCIDTIKHTGKGCPGDTLMTSVKHSTLLQWKKDGQIMNTVINKKPSLFGTTIAGQKDGTYGLDSAHLNYPQGIFRDSHGSIYIADPLNGRVLKWAPGATYGVVVGPPNDTFTNQSLLWPLGVYVDDSDNVYVSDFGKNRVQKYKPGAKLWVTVAGQANDTSGQDSAHLSGPRGICLDKNKNIYIADGYNNRVQKWAPGSSYGITVAGRNDNLLWGDSAHLYNPSSVIIDTADNIYISDRGNNRVQKWARGATYGITVAGNKDCISGTDSAHFNLTGGVYLYNSILFVVDAGNNRVMEWPLGNGYGITVAGQSNCNYGLDSAHLFFPQDVTVDSMGNIFVCDAGNNRIQEWKQSLHNLNGTYKWIAIGAGNYGASVKDSSGCIAVCNSIVINGISNNNLNASFCPGKTYNYQGSTYSIAGTYTFIDTSKAGCDSNITLNLSVYPINTYQFEACILTGQNYKFNGHTYSSSGVYYDTLIAQTGCDSIITVNLKVVNDTFSFNGTGKNCPGDSIVIKLNNAELLRVEQNNRLVYSMSGIKPSTFGVTVAGAKNGDIGSDSAHFWGTGFVYVDGKGNVFVPNYGANCVMKWSPGAKYGITVAGAKNDSIGGSDSAHLMIPVGVFLDKAGYIYVSDLYNNRVQKWAQGAKYGITVAGNKNGRYGSDSCSLYNPVGIFVDDSENIYVADGANNRVQRWAHGATYGVTVAGHKNGMPGRDSASLNSPQGIWVDNSNNIYIGDEQNNRVQKWAPGATYGITVAGNAHDSAGSDSAHLSDPVDVKVDKNNNIFIVDGLNDRVQEWPEGAKYALTVAGNANLQGADSNELFGPNGLWVDSANSVYVGDYFNNRVQKWTQTMHYLSGIYTIAADSPGTYTALANLAGGCQIVSNSIIIHSNTHSSILDTICAGGVFNYNGTKYISAGVYTINLSKGGGCDSVVTLNLKVINPPIQNIYDTLKTVGDSVIIDNKTYRISGSYSDTLHYISSPCDSVILNISITGAFTCQALFTVDSIDTATHRVYVTNRSTGQLSHTWYLGDGDSSKATAFTHNYTSGGTYNLCLKIKCIYGDTSRDCHLINGDSSHIRSGHPFTLYVQQAPTAVENIVAAGSNIRVYPNPNGGHFIIDINTMQKKGKADIQVLNIFGQPIYKQVVNNINGRVYTIIDNNDLPSGLYMVKVLIGSESYRQKIVVEN